MLSFVKEVISHFNDSNAFQKGASLVYYAVFSLLPIIMIMTSLLGLFFGQQAVSGGIYAQFKGTLGEEAAMQIQDLIANQHSNHNSIITTIIGFATLGLSASGMFTQIHNSFNDIWEVIEKPRNTILNYFSKRLISLATLIFLFSILLISASINSFLLKHSHYLAASYQLYYQYEHIISFVLTGFAFAAMYKFLGNAIIKWKVVLLGGFVVTLLFMLGKIAIGIYIGHSHLSSTFGSASVLALVLVWVYYTSQIIFFGASLIKILSQRFGYEIVSK
mgnify:CR=1 FL=1|jgi:membrane protein